MLSSPPRSNRSCCTSCKSSRTLSAMASASSTPSALLSSSTEPIASMRLLSLATRDPSPRPVLPESPVRVYILLSRLAIHIPARRLLFCGNPWRDVTRWHLSWIFPQTLTLWHSRGARIGTEFLQFQLQIAMQRILPLRDAVQCPIVVSRQRCFFDRFQQTRTLRVKVFYNAVECIQVRRRFCDGACISDRTMAGYDTRRVQLCQLLQCPLPALEIAVANIGNAVHRYHAPGEQHAGF